MPFRAPPAIIESYPGFSLPGARDDTEPAPAHHLIYKDNERSSRLETKVLIRIPHEAIEGLPPAVERAVTSLSDFSIFATR